MSGQEHQEQEWILVLPRKNKKIYKEVRPDKVVMRGQAPLQLEKKASLTQAFSSSASLSNNTKIVSELIANFEFEQVSDKAKKNPQLMVHCLGLGNFQNSLKPYLQLLFLKRAILHLLEAKKLSYKVNVFDPVFAEEQKALVLNNDWSCNQLETVDENLFYIFYLPHCEKNIHQQVCALKKSSPSKTRWLVIGNSINEYKLRSQLLNQPVSKHFEGMKLTEHRLCDFQEAFNDTYAYLL